MLDSREHCFPVMCKTTAKVVEGGVARTFSRWFHSKRPAISKIKGQIWRFAGRRTFSIQSLKDGFCGPNQKKTTLSGAGEERRKNGAHTKPFLTLLCVLYLERLGPVIRRRHAILRLGLIKWSGRSADHRGRDKVTLPKTDDGEPRGTQGERKGGQG